MADRPLPFSLSCRQRSVLHGLCHGVVAAYVSLSAYLSFFIAFLLPFALGFELPLVLLVLSRLGLVTVAMLKGKRRVFVILAFIFAGVVSPTRICLRRPVLPFP